MKAEKVLKHQSLDFNELSIQDVQHIVHELQVHQTELELQNEELIRTQNELKDSFERYADLFDFAPVGYFTFDRKGLIIHVNITGANKLGIERSFLIKQPFVSFVAPDRNSRKMFYSHVSDVFRSRERQICELNLEDRSRVQFNARLESLAVKDSEGNFSQCRTAIIDITELKKAEEKLKIVRDELITANKALQAEIVERKRAEKAEQYARVYADSIVETLRESIVVLDLQLRVVRVNQTFYNTFKVTPKETLNKFIYDLGDRQWDIPKLRELLEEILPENTQFQDFEVEYNFQNIGHKTMLLNARRIRQSNVNIELILLAIDDITEKKKLESQLLHSQRMESIGTLAGGIAHDLNNMLAPMMLSLRMLKQKLTDEESQKLITILEKNSQRSADLIKNVMSFSRGIEGEHRNLRVMHLVSEIEKIAKETFPKNITLQIDVPDDLWLISGDATQLYQVIMNICVNARDAMPDGGILSIKASNFFVDKNFARLHTESKIGTYIVITVSDTGIGIPVTIIDKIFEPFFTTKEFGKGTGLGLSTALAIVKGHGGFISVYSEVGKGTVFRVYLPAIKKNVILDTSQIAGGRHDACEEQFAGKEEWILVAEVEESIRDVTFSTLEINGYRALVAKDGAEAVALYAENLDKIKVVLMDLMMPVMNGQDSITALRRINPEVKIIAVSGLTEYTNGFLSKPYTAERLLETIHDVLCR
jgi:PAS domain S-box-containing protein